ncbi:carcinine hydrolase/isopenicillin-N N-acyltransferase family protein [Lentzea albidocapillata]|uniref:Predicted choloylglycine hydrolase n=1 Tax=Lentzea albidocapillata TaxID=40571 RepID=A0A1W2DHY8_9PSEU|nr:carcinine hydrolase/isopenicillin-N N-acyltransferase family protein [Lentzea albidocapillata]SMC96586.1 Predicted choloylglycine hydrolase [Lentzea albidocapillata]
MIGGTGCSTTFRAFAEERPGARWREHVGRHWPRLRPEIADDLLAVSWRAAVLDFELPHLAPIYADLAEESGVRDRVFAAYLTHVDLPLAVVSGRQATAGRALVRNLELGLDRYESTLWLSRFGSRRVLGTTSGLWGLLDGMNEDGLAVSLTSGGTLRHDLGLSGPLLVRHLLEHCATVADVDQAMRGWRTSTTHDLAVLDAGNNRAAYRVAPRTPTRRGLTQHWDSTAEGLAAMLRPPRFRTDYATGSGTLHTAVYRPAEGTATFLWPDGSRTWGFGDFEPAEIAIEYRQRQHW